MAAILAPAGTDWSVGRRWSHDMERSLDRARLRRRIETQ